MDSVSHSNKQVKDWTNEDVVNWAIGIKVSEDTIEKLKKAGFTGRRLLNMSRDNMKEAGVDSALEQAKMLGHVHALNDKEQGGDESDGDRQRLVSVAGPKKPNEVELRKLRARVWDLFCQDEVASRTERLFLEGDMLKYNAKSWSSDKRRFILLDTALLWCLVTVRRDTMQSDSLILKGRLDTGEYNVIDIPDGSKQGRRSLKNALRVYNAQKDKWYSLVCPSPEEKVKWLAAFKEAGVWVEKVKLYTINTEAKKGKDMLLTDAERMDIMSKVRDGKMTLDEAMETTKQREDELQTAYDKAIAEPAEEKKEEKGKEETPEIEEESPQTSEKETPETNEEDAKPTEDTKKDEGAASIAANIEKEEAEGTDDKKGDLANTIEEVEVKVEDSNGKANPYSAE